jgi:hypothetical protein
MASGQEFLSAAEETLANLEDLKYILNEHLGTLEKVSMITSQNFLMKGMWDERNVGMKGMWNDSNLYSSLQDINNIIMQISFVYYNHALPRIYINFYLLKGI